MGQYSADISEESSEDRVEASGAALRIRLGHYNGDDRRHPGPDKGLERSVDVDIRT